MPLLDKIEDLFRAFMGALGPAATWQQTGKPLSCKGLLCYIEGLSAESKRLRNFGHRPPLHAMTAEHFIMHLHPVSGIEKRIPSEAFVSDRFRVGMKGALVAEGRCLSVRGRGRF